MKLWPDEKNTWAFLIDGDNLSPTTIEEAFAYLTLHGATVSVRRAYGGSEKLQGLREVLKRHAARAFLNSGKGTTDVALVVDAMDLLYGNVLPTCVAIGSSDGDFAPLVVRLRESGRCVVCFAETGKAATEVLKSVFDEVVFVDSQRTLDVKQEIPLAATKLVEPKVGPAIKQQDQNPSKTDGIKNAVSLNPPIVVASDLAEVQAILKALPGWLPQTVRQLNQIGKPLREAKVAKGSKPLHELFRKHVEYFKVLPTTGAPKQVKLLKQPH